LTRERLQLVVALAVLAAWLVGVIVAVYDGLTVLRVTTPLLTVVCGWLFTQKATEAG
jgi:hypothetical protein